MKAYELEIKLVGSKPLIWRKIIVPNTFTLTRLHKVIQIAMDWVDYHDYEFSAGKTNLVQSRHLEEIFSVRKSIEYVYDFGDYWEIKITKTKEIGDCSHNYPIITEYAEDSPPEDCGGIYGYYNMLKILSNPKHKEYENIKYWYEEIAYGGKFNLEIANKRLAKMAPVTKKE